MEDKRQSALDISIQETIEAMPDGVLVIGPDGRIVLANRRAEELFGYKPKELLGERIGCLIPEEAREKHKKECIDYFSDPKTMPMGGPHDEISGRRKDGSVFPVDISLSPLKTASGASVITVVRDVIERKLAEETLKESESKLRAQYAAMPMPTYTWQSVGDDLILIDFNDAAKEMTHGKIAEHLGDKAVDFFSDTPEIDDELRRCFTERKVLRREMRYRLRSSGEIKDLAVLYAYIPPDSVIVHTEDISERKKAEATIKRLAFRDPLTNMANRRLLKDHLEQAVAAAKRDRRLLALLFIDLDAFKRVNDTLGHDIGDLVLKAVGRRLRGCLRRGDTAARLGGDEFTVLAPRIEKSGDAAVVARKIIDELSRPYAIKGHWIFIGATIGISVYPADGKDSRTLLRNADAGLHRAKADGGNTYRFYAPEIHARAIARMRLENDLRGALEREELKAYYQPCVSISTGELIGAEALLRWRHPERGLVMPADFIPLAEETGMIVPIGEWVLKTACAQSQAWRRAGLGDIRVMVNISGRQFREGTLIEVVASALAESGCGPEDLVLEITETLLAKDISDANLALYELRDMGIKILLDDFGIGFSSLSSLKLFPIDTLKIDKSFIDGCATNPDDAAIVSAVMSMAESLRLNVIAEGVETPEQLAFIRAQKCQAMQGYLFSRPVPAAEFEELLRAGRRLPGAA